MVPIRLNLLTNASATGTGKHWPGGRGQFAVVGTFSGATVTLQTLGPDGSTYVSLGADAALTAAGLVNFDAPEGMLRALVAGGPPSGLYATAVGIRT